MEDQDILNVVFSNFPQKKINSIIVYPDGNTENLCVILEEDVIFRVPSLELKDSHLGQIDFMTLQEIGDIWEENDSFVNNLEKGRWLYSRPKRIQ